MSFLDEINIAVSKGETKSQFAIPDGEYRGDLFFITDKDNKILIGLQWDGSRWVHEHETFEVQEHSSDSPAGLKPVSIKMIKREDDNGVEE